MMSSLAKGSASHNQCYLAPHLSPFLHIDHKGLPSLERQAVAYQCIISAVPVEFGSLMDGNFKR